MENFKNYFKFPLKYLEDHFMSEAMVFTSDSHRAFDFLFDDNGSGLKKDIVKVLNGEKVHPSVKSRLGTNFEYDKGLLTVDSSRILVIRGWGYLTGIGALNLDSTLAAEIQDEFGEYILNKLMNEDQ